MGETVTPDRRFYGHTTTDGRPWEPLIDHLQAVSALAGSFADAFGAGEWGRLVGHLHDLGKYSSEFQEYLLAGDPSRAHLEELAPQPRAARVDHSTAGAQHAASLGALGRMVAYVIAGHHGGLPDWVMDGESGLKDRLRKPIPNWKANADTRVISQHMPSQAIPTSPRPENQEHASFRVAFWTRMLFSCLCDADFLATERFVNPDQAAQRPHHHPSMSELFGVLRRHMSKLVDAAQDTRVNRQRQRILQECVDAADTEPGFFSLCVPTGGGKTLSSMAFALKHAERFGLRRVMMAVPYTSIIEQNAEVYRRVFGNEVVVEHHSSLDPDQVTRASRLQSENWDTPIVVTTSVQLFESLFANRPRRCRKLHNLTRSVIVLDEAQTIPVDLLHPTLWALRELVDLYGCSIVLCSATQPAVEHRDGFSIGLRNVRPITKDPEALHQALVRTEVEQAGALDRESLVEQLQAENQVLCVVNTKRSAAETFAALGDETHHYHLSTAMCAAHRLETLGEIRTRLSRGQPCRVVSTQLVEAGVDLDFPTVFRATCGLDSLAQAAGRCNREGNRERGRVVWFETEELPPPGALRQAAQIASVLAPGMKDLLSPESIRKYFAQLFWTRNDEWDRQRVLETCLTPASEVKFQFRTMAGRYRIIREDTTPIVVPYGQEGRQLVNELQRAGEFADWRLLRRLQRYTVQVRRHELAQMQADGLLVSVEGRYILGWEDSYDERLGLRVEGGRPPAADLVV
jgi:CRISPR-associated endonuclease/helicase Cas3